MSANSEHIVLVRRILNPPHCEPPESLLGRRGTAPQSVRSMTATTTESSLSPLRAVSYVRVSTLDQSRRSAEPEGLSIPAEC